MDWNDSQPDVLDELLRKAHWPEPEPEHLERLNREWQRVVWRRNAWVAGSLAAAALIPIAGLVVSLAVMQGRQPVELRLVKQPVGTVPSVIDRNPEAIVVDEMDRPEPAPILVRDPTIYEQTVVLLHRQQRGMRQHPVMPPEPTADVADPVAAAIQRLIDDPQLDAASVARELVATYPDCETRLQRSLERSAVKPQSDVERWTVLRLLASVATGESLPVLLTASRVDGCPPEVLDAIARLSRVEQLTALVCEETLPKRQRRWMVALLERRTGPALAAYLELASKPERSAAAIRAVSMVEHPPVEELFSALFSFRVTTRLAAARVLGGLNDPQVSKRLAQIALDGVVRREALIGLLHSSDPVAHEFLAYAQSDLALAPSLRALSSQLSQPNALY